jgi:hypothetical protein
MRCRPQRAHKLRNGDGHFPLQRMVGSWLADPMAAFDGPCVMTERDKSRSQDCDDCPIR